MPDHTLLKPGDRIRILHVRESALRTRERELLEGLEDAGLTADTIERIIAQDPVVTIDRVDEWGHAWFNCELKSSDWTVEEHTLAVAEDDSWEFA